MSAIINDAIETKETKLEVSGIEQQVALLNENLDELGLAVRELESRLERVLLASKMRDDGDGEKTVQESSSMRGGLSNINRGIDLNRQSIIDILERLDL